jgi:enoyl-CoA hydratase/carnithine racemase
MTFETLRFEKHDRVAWVTFATPNRLNAITEARLSEIERVLDDIESDRDLGALVLTGEGDRAFCVGLDLDLLDKAFADILYFERIIRRVAGIVSRIEALPIPAIAAINGVARAGGFEIALGCDFVVMADEARIGDAHSDSGVLPACAVHRLARKIGDQKAKALLFTARWLTGPEAVSWGLALLSVPRAKLLEETAAFVATLTDKPRSCLAALKDSVRETDRMSLEDATEYEIKTFVRYMGGEPYGAEGYRAFREKRVPSWRRQSYPSSS